MSVKVDLDQLADALTDFAFAYLITVGDDYRAHTVAVDPVLTDGEFRVSSIGNSTRRNLSSHPAATLVWPPRERGGYTLIVDGRGDVTDEALRVDARSRRAASSRSAAAAPTASGCGDDCVPLGG